MHTHGNKSAEFAASRVTSWHPGLVASRSVWCVVHRRYGGRMALFEELGGAAAIDAAVDIFYGKVLADGLISGFFTKTDMDAQRAKQRAFLTVAFGGPNKYTGRGMRAAHARAVAEGLTDVHFDAVAGHLAATLRELRVSEEKIDEVLAIVETTRDQVLGRAGAA